MSSYFPSIGQKTANKGIFSLSLYAGDSPISNQEKGYMVNDGICYSTFTYDSGSYVPISNMKTAIEVGKDYGVYIEFGVSSNLQITGASIKSSKLGGTSPATEGWTDYPDYYRIRPFDKTKTIDGKTVVTQIIDGKRQEKAYLMIGKCYDTLQDFDRNYPYVSVSSISNKWSGYFVQYVDSNVIMMGSQVSGVPVVFPMPFWGGPATSDKNKLQR